MRALLSVSDREGIVELARGLGEAGVECFATDGTRAHLAENGIEVRAVSDLTDAPEILGGRVKTLHPAIFAGLLARRDMPDHLAQLAEHGIEQLDIVVVNLYPFAEEVRKADTTLDHALEQIDIGGVALLRAAAKNFPGVAAVSNPTQYASVLRDLKAIGGGEPRDPPEARRGGVRPDRRLRRPHRELPEPAGGNPVPQPAHPGRREEGRSALRREPAPARRLLRGSGPASDQHQPRAADRRQGPVLQQPPGPRRRLADRERLQDAHRLHREARQSVRAGERGGPRRGVPAGARG